MISFLEHLENFGNAGHLSFHTTLMPNSLSFQLQNTRGVARAGVMHTPHGSVETPVFMPVGTLASVKALDMQDVQSTGAQIQLANTYHLYLRPGMEIMEKAGGIHHFSTWNGPLLTDSGGFQVWSLGKGTRDSSSGLAKVSEDGVQFKSHVDGSTHFFTPEKAVQIQQIIGSDIMMAFDEAMPDELDHAVATQSLQRTQSWAERCVQAWEDAARQTRYGKYQALFGIIQGARYRDLRERAASEIAALPVDGIALGGETIGYNMAGTVEVMSWLEPGLPKEKPRYAMGLGREPQDAIDAVLAGFDMFDCVGPTRLARNGALLVGQLDTSGSHADKPTFASPFANSRLNIGRSEFQFDPAPLDEQCGCQTCSHRYSRAYLHHLFKTKELSYYRLASIHNVWTMIHTVARLREWILTGN